MRLPRPWWPKSTDPAVVLDTVLVREISQTREQLQSLMERLADFDARLTVISDLMHQRDPVTSGEADDE